jgi:methionine-gamma-lyase
MNLHLETRAIHAAAPELNGSRPVSVPIYQTSTFAFADPEACAEALNDPGAGFAYSRYRNPTTSALEDAAADLEGGAAAIAASSGMGAINTVLLTLLRTGDHVIAQRCLYGGTFSVFTSLAGRCGIDVTYITGRDPAEITAALRPESRLLFLETIANPTVAVGDLPALLAAGHAAGLTCVVDNTFATPVLCRPIEHGADIVVHSATKYLGGHDDVTLGLVVSARREMHRVLWKSSVDLGVAADPFAAWLTVRGLKTLALRMARHCANAAFLAERLEAHPAVAAVHWPGLAGHPDHEVARRLLSGYGGMVAFDVTGGREAGLRFIAALRLAAMAPSLGEHPRLGRAGTPRGPLGRLRAGPGRRPPSMITAAASRPSASARPAPDRAACRVAARAAAGRCAGPRHRGWSRAA